MESEIKLPYFIFYSPAALSRIRQNVIGKLYEMRDKLHKNFSLPEYERDFELYNDIYNEYLNCYAYALQLTVPITDDQKMDYPFYVPGFLSGEFIEPFDSRRLMTAVAADCEFLGLNCMRNVDTEFYNPEGYNVSVFIQKGKENCNEEKEKLYMEFNDFHFIRQNVGDQNINGNWSHLLGWGKPVEKTLTPTVEPGCSLVETVNISRKK